MKYQKKPVVVEAMVATIENMKEIKEFTGDEGLIYDPSTDTYYIRTLEGNIKITSGDYIIKGVAGEFYPCKPEIFHQTYEVYGEKITTEI